MLLTLMVVMQTVELREPDHFIQVRRLCKSQPGLFVGPLKVGLRRSLKS